MILVASIQIRARTATWYKLHDTRGAQLRNSSPAYILHGAQPPELGAQPLEHGAVAALLAPEHLGKGRVREPRDLDLAHVADIARVPRAAGAAGGDEVGDVGEAAQRRDDHARRGPGGARQAPRVGPCLGGRLGEGGAQVGQHGGSRVEPARVQVHEVRLDLEGVEDLALERPAGGAGELDREGVEYGRGGGCGCLPRVGSGARDAPRLSVLGHVEAGRVDQRAAVGKPGGANVEPGDGSPTDVEVEIDERLGRVDDDAVLGHAGVHGLDEAGGLGPLRGHEQKVVDEAEQEAVRRVEELQHVHLEVGVEVVAQGRREDGALWDAFLLPKELFANLDEVLLDVGRHQVEDGTRVKVLLEDVFDEDGVVLLQGRIALDEVQERLRALVLHGG